jgi:hypothetical protein
MIRNLDATIAIAIGLLLAAILSGGSTKPAPPETEFPLANQSLHGSDHYLRGEKRERDSCLLRRKIKI